MGENAQQQDGICLSQQVVTASNQSSTTSAHQQQATNRFADYFVICGLDLDTGLEADRFAGKCERF